MKVNVKGQLTETEVQNYINYIQSKNPRREIESIEIAVDEYGVSLGWTLKKLGFEWLQRITGYLMGALSRFNDAVRDRVKHSIKRDGKGGISRWVE